MSKKELGIYIHIPYCKQKCYYCDFISYTNTELVREYINSIKKELDLYNLENYNVTTIYIGGGTPSYIDSQYIIEIIEQIKNKIKDNETKFENIEITIEVNPGTVIKEKVQKYKNVGINRLSIGLQTTNDKLLKQIGRIHTNQEFLQTYKIAKDLGYENINVDLMIGLPNQTIEDINSSIKEVVELKPTHISVYSLILEENTKLEKLIEQKILYLPNEEKERQMYWYVKDKLELSGYKQYEISNFAKIGMESKHNINCWNQKEYIGLGVAAHSYLNDIRYSNTINVKQYIENIKNIENKYELDEERFIKNNKIYNMEEIQTKEDKMKEYMLLGLRKIDGISISKFKEKFIDNPIYIFKNSLNKLADEELIVIDGDNIKLTNRGLDLANIVWEEFI